ncbi:MAG: M16 family metallopeptidase [Planctomycetota bacterium]
MQTSRNRTNRSYRSGFRAEACVWGVVLLIGLAAGPWAHAQPATQSPQEASTTEVEPTLDQAPEYLSVDKLPDGVTLARLSNGLTVIVQENHVAPVATVRCAVRNTGSAFEGEHLGAGISHVLEHVVAGGSTTRRSEKEIERMIDQFGGATNAYTSNDLTVYFIDCPARDVSTAIELVADNMQHTKFEPSEFERELKVVRRELADGEVDRDRVQWNLLNQTVFQVHPARHPIIGYLEVLNQTTNAMITNFYRDRYIPNNMVFTVVGDVDTETVLKQVAERWKATPRGPETYVPLPEEPEQVSPREAVRAMDGQTYDMTFAWPTVPLSSRDMYALDVAAYILTEGDSSRLVRRLKYDEQLVLSVNSASYTPHFVNGFFAIMASSSPETWERASQEILNEVYRLHDELVSPAELAKAKKQKAAEQVFDRQTVQNAANSLARSFIATGDPLFDETYVDNIQQVTAEDVRAVARKYLVPERLNRVTITPPGGAVEAAAEERKSVESEVEVHTLDNGLRVLLKRHSQLPLVNIQAYILGSSLVDTPETAGRSALVAAMLDKGAGGRSAEEIADYFDSIGGQFGFSAGRFTLYGSASILRDDFEKAAEIFADCWLRPELPQDQFEKVQKLALLAIARRNDDPSAEIAEAFADALPASSPFHVVAGGKTETVSRLTVDDLKQYHQQYFVPSNMVVTVFGDIDPQQALKLVEKHFGSLPASPGFERPSFDRSNKIDENVVLHKETGKPTGMVVLGYEGPSILNQEDFAAITLLDAVMSGYGYPGGWLHTELRGEGLVYGVHAYAMAGPAPGFFAAMAQTQPDKIREVVARIQKSFERARRGEISEEEFETAVKMVIALKAQENTTISSQAQEAALDELYGLGYGYGKTFESRMRAVKLDDLKRVADKYFGNYVLVTSSNEAGPQ